MAVTRRLRYEVFRRDDHACRYCGARAPDASLTIDHVVPIALGGKDEPGNLVTACADCNAGKSSVAPDAPLVEGVAEDAVRWGKAMERAAALQAAQRELADGYVDIFDEVWSGWKYADDSGIPRPPAWRESIRRFHSVGLEFWVLGECIPTAMERGRRGEFAEFSYLCGMAWRILDERQEIAQGLVVAEEGEDA